MPDICQDVVDWDFKKIKPGEFDEVLASVPCTKYSRALATRSRNLQLADAVLQRLVQYLLTAKPVDRERGMELTAKPVYREKGMELTAKPVDKEKGMEFMATPMVQEVLTIVRGVECHQQGGVESGEKLRLMRVRVQFENECGMALEILWETGAQTNSVRTRVVPDRYLRESKTLLGLKMVSGVELSRGTNEVAALLRSQGCSERERHKPKRIEDAVFCEAQIHVEAILSFP